MSNWTQKKQLLAIGGANQLRRCRIVARPLGEVVGAELSKYAR